MNTNLVGKFATCPSCSAVEASKKNAHIMWGEIVGVLQVDLFHYIYSPYQDPLPCRTILLIRLGTFDRNKIIEMPSCYVKIWDTEKEASEYV